MHNALRQSLAFNLKAIVCQKLLPSIKPGVQRVPDQRNHDHESNHPRFDHESGGQKLSDAIRIGFLEGMPRFQREPASAGRNAATSTRDRSRVATNPEALKMAFKGIKIAQPGIL